MKKLYKVPVTAFALALVLAAPQAALTSHASSLYGDGIGFNGDSEYHSDGYGEQGALPEPSSGSSSSSSSSSSSDSYDSGIGFNADAEYHEEGYGEQGALPDPNGGSATVAAPKKNSNDITVGATGGQKFRIVMNNEHTSYQIYHCGISRITFNVTDAKDNIIPYKAVALEQGEDKLWYANVVIDENIDTKDFTVNVLQGDATYLSTELCVSGIKINGTLALSTVPAQISGTDTDEAAVTPGDSEKVANYHCNCGYSITDYEALKQHMLQHVLKGEANSYCTTYE